MPRIETMVKKISKIRGVVKEKKLYLVRGQSQISLYFLTALDLLPRERPRFTYQSCARTIQFQAKSAAGD
jgi:hypothetical protein